MSRGADERGSTNTETILGDVVDRIRRTVRPDKIVLFGSRARADARHGSDFDVLIVMPSTEPRFRRSRPIYAALADIPAEIDVLVYTPREVREWGDVPQAFVTTALREGRVLYEEHD